MSRRDWRDLTRRAGLKLQDGAIEVKAGAGRVQHLSVAEEEVDTIRVWTMVARRSVVEALEKPELVAWIRNHHVDLVDFRIDSQGRLVGEATVPMAGLTVEEWSMYVRIVAQASDRLEYLLTGRDIE